jgi:hypothetical protein
MADTDGKEGKRDRSPKFPYIGLAKALERIQTLYDKVKRYDARIADIAKDWGLSATSSSTDRTVAALQSFGLIEDSGSGDNRKIKLSELGARIIADQRPGVRESLLAEAALKPPIISDYARKWDGSRPDEVHALGQLQFDGGFTAEGAKMFLRVYDETIRFTQGRQSDKEADTGGQENRDSSANGPDNSVNERQSQPESRPQRREVKVGMKEDVFSLREGDVTLQWPETLSADSYQDLEDWTKLLLRKIKRSVAAPTDGEDA